MLSIHKFLFFVSLPFIFAFHSLALSGELTKQLMTRKKMSSKEIPAKTKKIMGDATRALKKENLGNNAPNVGDNFPVETFLDSKKQKVEVSSFWKDGYAIIKFYRGHWCPYCQLELKAYQNKIEDFNKLNAKIIVFTPDNYKYINKTSKRFKLGFPILSDRNNLFAKKLGIVFDLNKDVQKVYKNFKIDLNESQGNEYNQLPLPATYVVDRNGKVIYKFANADYTLRADPVEVIDFLKGQK